MSCISRVLVIHWCDRVECLFYIYPQSATKLVETVANRAYWQQHIHCLQRKLVQKVRFRDTPPSPTLINVVPLSTRLVENRKNTTLSRGCGGGGHFRTEHASRAHWQRHIHCLLRKLVQKVRFRDTPPFPTLINVVPLSTRLVENRKKHNIVPGVRGKGAIFAPSLKSTLMHKRVSTILTPIAGTG